MRQPARAARDADVPVSLSSYVEAAVLAQIRRGEREHNNGQAFPQRRQKNLKSGPPVTK